MKIQLPYCDAISYQIDDNLRGLLTVLEKVKRDVKIGFIRDMTNVYIAMDRCGRMYLHTHQPIWNAHHWLCIGKYTQSYLIGSNAHQPNAKQSLVKLSLDQFENLIHAVRGNDTLSIDTLINGGKQWTI